MVRMFVLLLAVVAIVGLVGAPAFAADDTHEGTFVSYKDGKLTMTDKDKKEHSHDVAKDAKVTIDGKDAKLTDLKKDQKIKVTVGKDGGKEVVTKIEATSK